MRRMLTLGGVLTLVVCALAWIFLAPAKLGGRTTYVVTHGISMEPKFHTGDLAILRAQHAYDVGDIVAYRSQTLHTVVMHRIVGEDGGTFTFKGDNNSWLDPDHPTQADLLGGLELQVPGGGRYLAMLHSTAGYAVLGGILALILLGGTGRARRRRALRTSGRGNGGRHRAGRHRAATPASTRAPASTRTAKRAARQAADRTPLRQLPSWTTPPVVAAARQAVSTPPFAVASAAVRAAEFAPSSTIVLPDVGQTGPASDVVPSSEAGRRDGDPVGRRPKASATARSQLAGAACLLIACLGGELWLSQIPTTAPTTRPISIAQTGTFGYAAAVPQSLIYPDGTVHAGDPIFTKIVHSVDFSFTYQADAPTDGTVALTAALVGPSGWRTPLASGPVTPVANGHGAASVHVDLAAAKTALDQFATATGLNTTSASLVVEPTLHAKGNVDGQPLDGSFSGKLTLSVTPDQLTVVPAQPGAAGTGTADSTTAGDDGSTPAADPMTVSSPLKATVPSTGPRVLSALGQHIAVRPARIALGVACIVALGLLLVALIGSRREGRAEDDVITALRQYGDRIVDAESIPLEGPVVELTSLAALHSIAERYDRVILHSVRGERHSYVVRDELSWYRYDIRPDRAQHAARRSGARLTAVGVEGTVIALQPRLRTPDILPGGVGVSAWSEGYSRAG